jgi:hypothetical protein
MPFIFHDSVTLLVVGIYKGCTLGVTIHFEGQLPDEEAYRRLIETSSKLALNQGWLTEPIEPAEATLLRVRDEQDWDYTGPVKGLTIYPHEDCEPVRLEFDRDLYVQEYVKTQFAGPHLHVKIIDLLNSIEPFFLKFTVEDEGEYRDTRDLGILSDHMERISQVIDDELRKNPSIQTKVKLPSGRIVDIIG